MDELNNGNIFRPEHQNFDPSFRQNFGQEQRNFVPPNRQNFRTDHQYFDPSFRQNFGQEQRNFVPPNGQNFRQDHQYFDPSFRQNFGQEQRNFVPPNGQNFRTDHQYFDPSYNRNFSQDQRNQIPHPQRINTYNEEYIGPAHFRNQYQPQQYYARPEPQYNAGPAPHHITKEEFIKKEVKRCYNRTGISMLVHGIAILLLMRILEILFSFSAFSSNDLRNILADDKMETGAAIVSVLSYSLANIVCAVLGLALTNRIKEMPGLARVPQTRAFPVPFAFLSVLGFQGIIHIIHNGYFSVMGITTSAETSVSSVNADVMVVYILYSVILAPISEEIMFRGMVLKNLSVIDKKFAVFFSAFLFGLYHENVLQMITATLLGILLGYVAVKTDSILITIGLHIFNNLFIEIHSAIPESRMKTIITTILFFGIGIVSIFIFFISMRKQDTPENNYEKKFDPLPEQERKLKLRAALTTPAIIIYVTMISLTLILEAFLTYVYAE